MRPSIFLHVKKGLICTAMLSALVLSGCQLTGDNRAPITPTTPEQISSEVSRYQSIIDSAQGKPSVEALRAYISQEPLLTEQAAHQANIDGTWQMLTQMTPNQVEGIGVEENTLAGWVDLLDIYLNNRDDIDALRAGINDWKIRYADHPAVKTPPNQLTQSLQPPVGTSPKIALFLPMSGQGKVFGEAIMRGFMDAQKGLPQAPVATSNSAPVATPEANSGNDVLEQIYAEVAATTGNSSPSSESEVVNPSLNIAPAPTNTQSVKVFDTNGKSLPQLLQQAQSEGFTLVVGPLLKPEVQAIAQAGSPLSVLALNELDADKLQPRPNLCYFSLSPEDEAKNAAAHMMADGKRAPLLLVPSNAFGERIAKAFAEEWQSKGGATVLKQSFGSTASLKESINRGAGIRMTGIPVIVNQQVAAKSIDGQNYPELTQPEPQVSSASAVDAVYIVATRDELTLIKPMIEMAISSRQRPALYASSRSNQAGNGADFRFEMEGVKFSDIPLLAGANNNLRKQAQQKLNNDYSLLRLYALGVDAWALANNYDQLQHNAQFRLQGASGALSVDKNCVVYRDLPWLQFNQGQIKLAK
ncbi:penicillin-binding protein activator [Providencia stuartii]|uniref:penicillin-binding protein activator n=1 Tax=Providencia TaxID=586 RepID=UPI000537E3FD|nr:MULTISPECIES: penicillin-binding protein activator [Providencia]SST04237.1 Lipoprotein activator of PBP from the outer membrane A [Acinetobacter baumannii]AMG67118.1 penicillin-binding protein activator [Providencia stuartii]AXO19936.1 penicillin-binding protein activator [Providencia stuartii]KSX92174.1 penicillin-binding protein activator LpoA [Providencia stuartii]MBN5591936.1 penicillin-binding protein activator [Providencia stuartii]